MSGTRQVLHLLFVVVLVFFLLVCIFVEYNFKNIYIRKNPNPAI